MKKIALIVVAGFFCIAAVASAGDISTGTFSVRGGSNLHAESLKIDPEGGAAEDTDTGGLHLSAGYFIIDNLELGLSLLYSSRKVERDKTTARGVAPFVMYHLPVSEKMNLIASGQVGYFAAEQDNGGESYDGDGIGFILGAGIEYFIVDSVALDCSVTYRQIDFEFDVGRSTHDVTQKAINLGVGVTVFIR